MANLCLSRFALACLATGLLAACDTEAGDTAQENAATPTPSETIDFNGTLNRSFAGELVPEVLLTDTAGETLQLGEVEGPFLLNLWATWCAPCVHEMPLLDDLAVDLEGRVAILTVSEDLRGAEVVEPFFAERGLENLPRWMDEENVLAFGFGGGPVLPLSVLYDAEGREVWRVIGAYDWSSEEARAQIEEGLAYSHAR